MKKAFTLLELLIVISVVGILAATVLILINPWNQIAKAKDARRKKEIDLIHKAIEDWFNDKGCYPKPSEICYDTPVNVCTAGSGGFGLRQFSSQICHICGNEATSPSFSPYLPKLPCDPEHKQKDYLYEVQSKTGINCNLGGDITSACPSWAKFYTSLSSNYDFDSDKIGCSQGGCGLSAGQLQVTVTPYPYGYSYGDTTGNVTLNSTAYWYCYNPNKKCFACGSTYLACTNPLSGCQTIYSSIQACQFDHP